MCQLSGTAELTNPELQEIVAAEILASISPEQQETEAGATQASTSLGLLETVASEARPGRPASPATLELTNQAGWETVAKQFEIGPENTMEQRWLRFAKFFTDAFI